MAYSYNQMFSTQTGGYKNLSHISHRNTNLQNIENKNLSHDTSQSTNHPNKDLYNITNPQQFHGNETTGSYIRGLYHFNEVTY